MAGRGVQPACIVPVSRAFRNSGYDRAGSGQTRQVAAVRPGYDRCPSRQVREPPMLGTQSAPGLPLPPAPELDPPETGLHPVAWFLARWLSRRVGTLLIASV